MGIEKEAPEYAELAGGFKIKKEENKKKNK